MGASLDRITSELASVVGLEVEVCDLEVVREMERPCVGDGVHIAFRLGLLTEGELRHGAFVLGLEPALEAAGQLLGRTQGELEDAVRGQQLDEEWKEGLMEVASVFGAAMDVALRDGIGVDVHACSEGCQGVRAGSAPMMGDGVGEERELLVGRFRWRPEGSGESEGFLAVQL